jgi:DUF4097 and DUF4098 domain-containing protein YvlB
MARPLRSALALLILVPTALAAQRSDDEWIDDCDRGDDRLVAFCEVRVERVAARGSIDVDASPNGGVQVIGWNRNEVEVHARVKARGRSLADARSLASEIDVRTSGGTIRSDGPNTDRDAQWHVEFVVYVPNRTDVVARAHNGPLSVTGVEGRMDVATQNGPLALREVGGDVMARTQNGPLSVHLSGNRWSGTGLDAETHNGPATLYVPDGYSAELETGTVNGPLNSDIPLTVQFLGRRDRRMIETTLGSGGAPLRVVTTNGPVSIRRN